VTRTETSIQVAIVTLSLGLVGCGGDDSGGGNGPGGSCDAGLSNDPEFGCVRVCDGDRVVETQADFDALVAEQCVVITQTLNFRETDLSSLVGLEGLRRVDGSLLLGINTGLVNLRGLDSLREVGGTLGITSCQTLTDLGGLENVATIGSILSLITNAELQSLGALDNLTSASAMGVTGNPRLPQCQVDALAARLGLECGAVVGTSCGSNDDTATCP
jgi:hypothetical protein